MTTPIDPMAAVKLLRSAIEKQIGPEWECNSDHPALREALRLTASIEQPTSEAVALTPFAWIVVLDSTGKWDGGVPMLDAYVAKHYIEHDCVPGWHLEPIYRADPPLLQPAKEAILQALVDHDQALGLYDDLPVNSIPAQAGMLSAPVTLANFGPNGPAHWSSAVDLQKAIDSPSIQMPQGLTKGEMRSFIASHAKPAGAPVDERAADRQIPYGVRIDALTAATHPSKLVAYAVVGKSGKVICMLSLDVKLPTGRPIAALRQPGQADKVPEGWMLAPIEPTPSMIRAGENSEGRSTMQNMESYSLIYRDMLAVAPSPQEK